MSFYTYSQNNSGGGFHVDDNVGHYVIIEADKADGADDANDKAISVGLYFDGHGDCSCCGNRWYPANDWWNDRSDSPELYSETIHDFLMNEKSYWREVVHVYYKPGSRMPELRDTRKYTMKKLGDHHIVYRRRKKK